MHRFAAAALLVVTACTPPVEERTVLKYELTEHWPLPTDFTGLRAGMVLTTNNGEDTVSVLDGETGLETFRAPIGLFPMQLEGPHHLALDPAQQHLFIPISNYVSGAGSGPHGAHGTGKVPGYLLKISASTLLLEDQVVVDRSPGDVVTSSDGKTLYVSHYDLVKLAEAMNTPPLTTENTASSVAIIDAETMQRKGSFIPACAGAHGMALSNDEHTLYVTCTLSDELAVIDLTSSPPSVQRIPVGDEASIPGSPRYQPYAVAVHPRTGKLFISNQKTQTVELYDPADGSKLFSPHLDSDPSFGVFVDENTHFMVAVRSSNQVELLDAVTLERVRPAITMTPEVCTNAHAIERSSDGVTAFLVCEGDHAAPGSVVTITVPIFAVSRSTPVGVFPDAVKVVRP